MSATTQVYAPPSKTRSTRLTKHSRERGASRPPGGRSELKVALLFISPWILGFLAFQLYPLVVSLYYSLTAYSLARSPIFIGLSNYIHLFTADSLFRLALAHSLIFAGVSVPLNVTVAFAVALLLNRRVAGRGILRALYFIPAIVPSVANAMLWVLLLRTKGGLVNLLLGVFHIPAIDWLHTTTWALPTLIIVNLWSMGPLMVIFLAGLQDVPRVLYESARVDGARTHHLVWHVTIPHMTRVILFNVIISIITAFQSFAVPYVIFSNVSSNGGGFLNAGLLYPVQLFNVAFVQFEIGYASAMAWVLTIIIFIFSLVSIRVSRRYTVSDN